jgi:hypothetical protein
MSLLELSAKQDCYETITRFLCALDRGDNSEAASLMAEDGSLALPTGEIVGAAVQRALLERAGYVSRHVITNVLMNVVDENLVECRAYVATYSVSPEPDDSPPWPMPSAPAAIGNWTIRLAKSASGWRISRIVNEVVFGER